MSQFIYDRNCKSEAIIILSSKHTKIFPYLFTKCAIFSQLTEFSIHELALFSLSSRVYFITSCFAVAFLLQINEFLLLESLFITEIKLSVDLLLGHAALFHDANEFLECLSFGQVISAVGASIVALNKHWSRSTPLDSSLQILLSLLLLPLLLLSVFLGLGIDGGLGILEGRLKHSLNSSFELIIHKNEP